MKWNASENLGSKSKHTERYKFAFFVKLECPHVECLNKVVELIISVRDFITVCVLKSVL
jgi:hypothetical protein